MSSAFGAEPGSRNDGYLAYHAPRFRFVLRLAQRMLPDGAQRVLDIGPSPLSTILRQHLPCSVDTLGLESATEPGLGAAHYHADLNLPDSLPAELPAYDLIVFAEVLEHLHTSPALALKAVTKHLTSRGVLILQTPNAASLPKRLKLLAGWNPYELIRDDPSNPGHFREYTLRELLAFAAQANLQVVSVFRRFYFDARYAHHEDGVARSQPILGGLKNCIYRTLPPFLREGITVVLSRLSTTCLSSGA